jgi:hypothetical protein
MGIRRLFKRFKGRAFYKNRISQLEQENARLKQELVLMRQKYNVLKKQANMSYGGSTIDYSHSKDY